MAAHNRMDNKAVLSRFQPPKLPDKMKDRQSEVKDMPKLPDKMKDKQTENKEMPKLPQLPNKTKNKQGDRKDILTQPHTPEKFKEKQAEINKMPKLPDKTKEQQIENKEVAKLPEKHQEVENKDNSLSSRSREGARDAFFKSEPAPAKFDIRERLKERELEKEKAAKELSQSAPSGGPGTKEIEGYVGFANLPNQVYRKSVKRGFEFTLMVVGESGLGKSTLVNSLFLTDLYSAEYPGPSHRLKKTVQVETTQVNLKEGGVQLRLSIIDTPGFGDAVDNTDCWVPVIEYLENKYEEYLNAESRVNRKTMPDNRVHCCLYFISPNGHGLKPLDIEFMKRLHDKVNIIPLIAKADTMTPDECREFKKTVLNEIARHKIKIYEFPDSDDEEEQKTQKKLKDRVPFAVVGSNAVVEQQGQRVRGRVYPWGTVEVENLEHNDFIALRNMVIRTHMQDLKDVTNNVHYENFRYNKLASVSKDKEGKPARPTSGNRNPFDQMQDERKEHQEKMKKMEAEMEQVFEMKVKEKRNKLKESEADLHRRAEQMKKSLEQQEKELEEKRLAFEREKATWEAEQGSLTLDDKNKKKKGLF